MDKITLTLYDGDVLFCVRNDFRVGTPGDGFRKALRRKAAAGGTGGKYTGAGLRLARTDFRTAAATPAAAAAAGAAAAGLGALLCGFTAALGLGSFQGWLVRDFEAGQKGAHKEACWRDRRQLRVGSLSRHRWGV